MASPSLWQSLASSFHSQFNATYPPLSARVPRVNRRRGNGVVSVRATAAEIVLVDKSEAEKTHRLRLTYHEKIVPLLKEEFSYTNVHQIPKIEKIVVNCGIGDAPQNPKGLEEAIEDLALITGQRPIKTVAKKSIAAFRVRAGQPLGIAVTLRKDIMYAFLDRLINLALPRTLDFQGVSPYNFDGHGNYHIGVAEKNVFPDITHDLVGRHRGLQVCIKTTATTDKEAYRLLALMGMPFDEDDEYL